MMEKQDNIQLELFSGERGNPEIKNYNSRNPLFSRLWHYEKTILIIIGIIITSIVSFSLGVDKGRKLSLSGGDPRLDLAAKPETAPHLKAAVVRVSQKQPDQQLPQEKPKAKDLFPAYTIQLATYRVRAYVQKEAEILKSKGLSPLILSRGNFTVLCVGNFSNKDSARGVLSGLEKRYQGCYIRRL